MAAAPLQAVAPRLAALAEADPGREVCGLVVARADGQPEAWPMRNAALEPRAAFALDPVELLGALRRLDGEGLSLLAVYHSHPEGGPDLSARDLDGTLAGGEPLLGGVAQVVVALQEGRASTVRAHRWVQHRFQGVDLWTSVR